MSSYRVFETEQLQMDLREIDRAGRTDIVEKLRKVVYPQLQGHPHFGPNIRNLRGCDPYTWRYRIGAWRFFYEIDEDEHIVFLIAARHRSVAH